jgi:hypothetical protein
MSKTTSQNNTQQKENYAEHRENNDIEMILRVMDTIHCFPFCSKRA